MALLKTPAEFDAYELNSAIKVSAEHWSVSAVITAMFALLSVRCCSFKCQKCLLVCFTGETERLETNMTDPCFCLPDREPERTKPV